MSAKDLNGWRELGETVRKGIGSGDRLVPGTISEAEFDAIVALDTLLVEIERLEGAPVPDPQPPIPVNYTGPDHSIECAYPPCHNRLRLSRFGTQWCSKEHRDATTSEPVPQQAEEG